MNKTFVCLLVSIMSFCLYPGIVHQSVVSIVEQKVAGRQFKHVIKSGTIDNNEYFMDGITVTCQVYYQELELAERKERQEELMRQETQRKNHIQFVESCQVQVATKLLYKTLQEISLLLDRVENPALEKFFIFADNTIDSYDQLKQLKVFTEQLEPLIQKKIASNDFDGLYFLFSKLEYWPTRLEKFFQDTVQNAIKKSDDTAMLKELLKLVSEVL
ncbi:MAG: hypothetical protein ACXWL5_00510 [Candidatus Chromulinivorax sp.]